MLVARVNPSPQRIRLHHAVAPLFKPPHHAGVPAPGPIEPPQPVQDGVEALDLRFEGAGAGTGAGPRTQGGDVGALDDLELGIADLPVAAGEVGVAGFEGAAGAGAPGGVYGRGVAVEEVELEEVGLKAGRFGRGGDVGGTL